MSRAEWPVAKIDSVSDDLLGAIHHHPANRTGIEQEIRYFRSKSNFASGGKDALPHRFDDIRKEIGPNVRMGVNEDLLGSAVRDEDLVNFAHGTALGRTGVKLPVRKGTGTALAKTIVRILHNRTMSQERG